VTSPAIAARRTGSRLGYAYERLLTNAISLYGTAVLRIGYGTAYLVFLLHEYPHHDQLWGPKAPWTPAMNQQFANDPNLNWFAVDRWWYTFLGHGGNVWFQFWYHAAMVVCLLFALGWRTRATSVMFAATIMMFTGRNVYLTDGGDNIMGLMAIYLAFTVCGRTWSLDARRARRRAATREPFRWPETPRGQVMAELEDVRKRIVTFLHNSAVLVIAAQICVVYAAAGLYKAQGSDWQDGTALYYTLHLGWFRPWPGLSNFFASQTVMIAIVAYMTVLVQIAFPFAVFSRWLKYPVLFLLLGMHFSIAIVMGLPLFSLAMMVGDAVFIPDSLWIRIGGFVRRRIVRRVADGLADRVPRLPRPRRTAELVLAGIGQPLEEDLARVLPGGAGPLGLGQSEGADGLGDGLGGGSPPVDHTDEIRAGDRDVGDDAVV
jgi:Vitamin K-dependent gamma-carboxylase